LKKLNHLSEIYNHYDAFIIDLWGVMHNGINLNSKAVEVVENLIKNKKRITFLSNAPRPNKNVIRFLKKLNMNEEHLKHILTSGEAAIKSLKDKKFGNKFFHLGPERDASLFEGLEKDKTDLKSCDFILCTGLFDNHENDLEYYKKLLKEHNSKKLICTNPDLIVHRGLKKEYCAGTIAEIFESQGGKVVYFGKPHEEVYRMCLKNNENTFVIGDNLNTDIKGANNLNLDSLFISGGVHRSEYQDENELEDLLKKYKVKTKYFQKNLCW
tara:strand:+ start:665 stop:1471 length:807 start_codon:yes stop_codon:yes gene_type:complete